MLRNSGREERRFQKGRRESGEVIAVVEVDYIFQGGAEAGGADGDARQQLGEDVLARLVRRLIGISVGLRNLAPLFARANLVDETERCGESCLGDLVAFDHREDRISGDERWRNTNDCGERCTSEHTQRGAARRIWCRGWRSHGGLHSVGFG